MSRTLENLDIQATRGSFQGVPGVTYAQKTFIYTHPYTQDDFILGRVGVNGGGNWIAPSVLAIDHGKKQGVKPKNSDIWSNFSDIMPEDDKSQHEGFCLVTDYRHHPVAYVRSASRTSDGLPGQDLHNIGTVIYTPPPKK